MQKRFVAYYRVSSDSQEENNSLDNQRRRIEAWASINNYEIAAGIEAVESATSKASDRRKFKQALDLMQAQKCDGLVVYDLDRFFRNTEEGLRTAREQFLERAKTLKSLNQNVDISTDDGWFAFGIFLLVSEKEARSIRRRMSDGKSNKVLSASGKGKRAFVEGSRPYGFTSTGAKGQRELIIDPEEYRWRQKILSGAQKANPMNGSLGSLITCEYQQSAGAFGAARQSE